METRHVALYAVPNPCAPYSLGKLIEWKPYFVPLANSSKQVKTPYSLGKLIEWKPLIIEINPAKKSKKAYSLLVREIN